MCARAENSQDEIGVEPTVPGCGIDEGGNIKVKKIFPSKSMKQLSFYESPCYFDQSQQCN